MGRRRVRDTRKVPPTLAHCVPDLKRTDLGVLGREGDYTSWWVAEDIELGDGVGDGVGNMSGCEDNGAARLEVAPT